MTEIQITLAEKTDMLAIMRLIAQPDMSPEQTRFSENSAVLFDQLKTNPWHRLYIARQKEEIVGTFSLLILQCLSHNAARSMIIEDVVVKTTHQGRGIGRFMMEFAIKKGKELGVQKFMLSSGDKRLEAHEFYESLGFKKLGFSFYRDADLTKTMP